MIMHLVEIFLPLADNQGRAFPKEKYAEIRDALAKAFGGVTAFTRYPAEGAVREGGRTVHDDIVVFEVMTETLDHDWWANHRRSLEHEFDQDEILIRATRIERL